MKNSQLIVFFTVVLAIYSSANIYIYLKGYNAISAFQNNRLWYFIVFILIASAFVAGKIIEARNSSVFSDILNIIGGFWMAFMLYGFLFLFLSDLAALALRIAGIINHENIAVYRKWAFLATLFISSVLIIA